MPLPYEQHSLPQDALGPPRSPATSEQAQRLPRLSRAQVHNSRAALDAAYRAATMGYPTSPPPSDSSSCSRGLGVMGVKGVSPFLGRKTFQDVDRPGSAKPLLSSKFRQYEYRHHNCEYDDATMLSPGQDASAQIVDQPRSAKPLLSSKFRQYEYRHQNCEYDDATLPSPGQCASDQNHRQEPLCSPFQGSRDQDAVPFGRPVTSSAPSVGGQGGCPTKNDIYMGWTSPLSMAMLILSVYSTIFSGVYLFTAIIQPTWGRGTSSLGYLSLGTASTLTALFAKTVELSFVSVFIGFLGQVISRRSLVKSSRGVTISEFCMRSWVVQPGFMITHWKAVRHASWTILGVLSLVTTVSAMLYTTASDALVSPKLKFSGWEKRAQQGFVQTTYANSSFVSANCKTPITTNQDPEFAASTCLQIENAGQAYHNYLNWIGTWADIATNGTIASLDIRQRPPPFATLKEDISVRGSWITPYDMSTNFLAFSRIVNNVTMAMPHAGIYVAANDPVNNILQPSNLNGQREYKVSASVLSPAVNVLCAEISEDELKLLIRSTPLNSTSPELDDLFQWGSVYGRAPPVFPLKPIDFNILMNTYPLPGESDSIYLLAKSAATSNYTICAMRSFLSPSCFTNFLASGPTGESMESNCEDPNDHNTYTAYDPDCPNLPSETWPYSATSWALALALNDGSVRANSSNARLLTQFIPTSDALPSETPSIAEALAVLSGYTLLQSILNATFVVADDSFSLGSYQQFNASVMTQQFMSSYTQSWQACFYPVLVLVFLINLLCLVYAVVRPGLMTDYTEPQNLFALALNSPSSNALAGSCGAGPQGDQYRAPLFISQEPDSPHFFIHEHGASWGGGPHAGTACDTAFEMMPSPGPQSIPSPMEERYPMSPRTILPYQRLISKSTRFL